MVVAMTLETEKAPYVNGKITIAAEKSWLIGIAVALFVQVFGAIWWASGASMKLEVIDKSLTAVQTQLNLDATDRALKATAAIRLEDRIARLEERDSDLSGSVKQINEHLAAIEAFMNANAKSFVNTKKR